MKLTTINVVTYLLTYNYNFLLKNNNFKNTQNISGEVDEDTEDYDSMQFIQEVMMPTISDGLSEMIKIFPNDPLRWLGNWLLTKTDVPK